MRPLALFFLVASCSVPGIEDEFYVGGGFSALPNIGITVGGGQVFSKKPGASTKAVELFGVWQPFDEELFADDGNAAAGDWYQVSLGINHSTLEDNRHWNLRYGVVWARALGEPNMVQLEGDYNGIYVAYGFETEFGDGWRMGPELQLNAIGMEGGRDTQAVRLVPQLAWRMMWSF